MNCKLCGFEGTALVCENKHRPFYICGECGLIFVPEQYWLPVNEERLRYDLHDNTVDNEGYVKYLSQAANIVTDLCRPGEKVLDFGCGKEAVLCRLLNDKGIHCRAYDPLYEHINTVGKDIDITDKRGRYGIIILCEVIEHVRDILGELSFIEKLLRRGGTIVIRTQIYNDPKDFPNWWYAQDPTHINFFNEKSLNKLASITGKEIFATEYPDIFIVK